ncbi:unnamed protein product [Ixodes pacificus]
MAPAKQRQKCQSLVLFLFMIGSAMIEHVKKDEKHHDGVLLTLSVWFHHFVT